MLKRRPWLPLILLCLAALAAPPVPAAGLGSGAAGAVLGQPLDFVVQVRLDAAETLDPACVSATVTAGERAVPAFAVRTVIERHAGDSARVRVQTLQGIDEPVIGVHLVVGCRTRIARHYVVLADPPPPALPSTLPVATGDDGGVASGASAAAAAASAPAPVALAGPVEAQAPQPSPASAGQPRSDVPPRRAVRPDARKPRPARPGPIRATARPAQVARLQLDLVEPASTATLRPVAATAAEADAVAQALQAVAEAASAARAAASAASASAERIASLERTVTELRAEAQSSNERAAQMRQRLLQSDGSGRWLLPLAVAAALLAALAAWLAWRLSAVQRAQQQVWSQAATLAAARNSELSPSRQPTRPIPFVTSEIQLPAAAPDTRPRPAWPPAAPPEAWPATTAEPTRGRTQAPGVAAPAEGQDPATEPRAQRTEVLPRSPEAPQPRTEVLAHDARTTAQSAPRDVSIEELIDLEQQAEFFIVLGQDEAAIDLLVDHLRNTGGGSPLPYLKLLEIHQRRGDHAAYERMRTRFNHRFNAYAPAWGEDLHGGRSLDDYPGVLPRLQQVWARPLDAMAELEALLFRKSRGELFDLQAYREVLFLYSLARDLLDREALESGSVDLLLPIADGGDFSSTAPAPFTLDRDTAEGADTDMRPTAPVDFDPSEAEPRSSIFDPLDEPRPRRG